MAIFCKVGVTETGRQVVPSTDPYTVLKTFIVPEGQARAIIVIISVASYIVLATKWSINEVVHMEINNSD